MWLFVVQMSMGKNFTYENRTSTHIFGSFHGDFPSLSLSIKHRMTSVADHLFRWHCGVEVKWTVFTLFTSLCPRLLFTGIPARCHFWVYRRWKSVSCPAYCHCCRLYVYLQYPHEADEPLLRSNFDLLLYQKLTDAKGFNHLTRHLLCIFENCHIFTKVWPCSSKSALHLFCRLSTLM